MTLEIQPLSDSNFDLWLNFYDGRALKNNPEWDGCYCQFYLNTESDEVSAKNRRDLACSRKASGTMQGYVAIENNAVYGWMAAGPSNNYPKIPKGDPTTARVVCFTIDPKRRGQGIATSLLKFGIDDLRMRGFKKVEARGVPEGKADPTNYPGPISLYEKHGFSVAQVFDDGYSLMELHL